MTRLSLYNNFVSIIPLLFLCASAVSAASLDDIHAQIEQGQYQKAVSQSDNYLASHPDDRDARFLRGLALARLGKTDAAIQVFGELARENPKLPEPANNLAVLYARQGEYEKARRWLEAAMATHPAYDIAHKNLGDVYTALAAVAYSKALDQQDQPSDLGVDLQLVDKLYEAPETAVATRSRKQQAQPQTEPASPKAGTPVAKMQQPEPEPTPQAQADEASKGKQAMRVVKAPEPKPEPAHAPQTGADAPQTSGKPAPSADPADIMPAVQAWADAWSDQDVDAYLNAYADNFYPGDDLTLAQWRAQRRERVSSPEFIKVRIKNPEVQLIESDRARVSFRQIYESDTYSDRVNKTLVLQYKNGSWRIVREISQPQ